MQAAQVTFLSLSDKSERMQYIANYIISQSDKPSFNVAMLTLDSKDMSQLFYLIRQKLEDSNIPVLSFTETTIVTAASMFSFMLYTSESGVDIPKSDCVIVENANDMTDEFFETVLLPILSENRTTCIILCENANKLKFGFSEFIPI